MATFTEEQFAALIAKMSEVGATPRAAAAREVTAANPPVNHTNSGAAALVGQIPACVLGKNKLKRYKKWRDWIKDAENKMTFLSIDTNEKKISFIRSCAGTELTEFWEKEARIRFIDIPADAANNVVAQARHTYDEITKGTKDALLKYVNRDRAIIELLRLEQGSRNFTDFLSEVEDAEYLCRVAEEPITSEDLQKMSLIAGLKDRTLAEKALTEQYTLKQLVSAALNRESSRANVEAMKARPTTAVSSIESNEVVELTPLRQQLNDIDAKLDRVMRVKQSGKYSRCYKQGTQGDDKHKNSKSSCIKCTYSHEKGQCLADGPGRSCYDCTREGHFAGSVLCKSRSQKKPRATTRRVEYETASDSEYESETETVARVDRVWPGVTPGTTRTDELWRVKISPAKSTKSKRVSLKMGGVQTRLFTDTGSKHSIIPPESYRESMGKVVPADCNLRAWGLSIVYDNSLALDI